MVHEGLEEEASEGSGEEVPVLSTSCPVSMTAVGSFCWGSEVGTAIGETWGQELDEEDGVEDKDTSMAHQVQIFEANEAEWEAIEWLAANPTWYEPEDSGSSVDVDCTVDLFELCDNRPRYARFHAKFLSPRFVLCTNYTTILNLLTTTHEHMFPYYDLLMGMTRDVAQHESQDTLASKAPVGSRNS